MTLFSRGLTVALLSGFLSLPGQTQTAQDFLVVQRVDRLVLYNKYQQRVTDSERQLLLPFAPMRILNRKAVLGDSFTRCMHVEVDGHQMYLLTDDNGKLIRNGSLGFEQIFTGTVLLSDTIQLLTGNPHLTAPTGSSKSKLSVGDKIVRRFRNRQGTYCRILDGSPRFGWIDLSSLKEGRDWKPFRTSSRAVVIPAGVTEKIRARIDEVNRTWNNLFDHFNEQTGETRPPPSWSIESSSTSITCTLTGSDPDRLRQSTLYLLKDIENIVLGSGLAVSHLHDRITIQVRQE